MIIQGCRLASVFVNILRTDTVAKVFVAQDRVSVCDLENQGTHSVDQVNLEL